MFLEDLFANLDWRIASNRVCQKGDDCCMFGVLKVDVPQIQDTAEVCHYFSSSLVQYETP